MVKFESKRLLKMWNDRFNIWISILEVAHVCLASLCVSTFYTKGEIRFPFRMRDQQFGRVAAASMLKRWQVIAYWRVPRSLHPTLAEAAATRHRSDCMHWRIGAASSAQRGRRGAPVLPAALALALARHNSWTTSEKLVVRPAAHQAG